MSNAVRGTNIEERELRKHLHDIEREHEQITARNPSHVVELEGEV